MSHFPSNFTDAKHIYSLIFARPQINLHLVLYTSNTVVQLKVSVLQKTLIAPISMRAYISVNSFKFFHKTIQYVTDFRAYRTLPN